MIINSGLPRNFLISGHPPPALKTDFVKAPGGGPKPLTPWRNSAFGTNNMFHCLLSFLCPFLSQGIICTDLHPYGLVSCSLLSFAAAAAGCFSCETVYLRNQFRERNAIEGHCCGDLLIGVFCGLCALNQLLNEKDDIDSEAEIRLRTDYKRGAVGFVYGECGEDLWQLGGMGVGIGSRNSDYL